MKLSVIIPVYNEERTICTLLETVRNVRLLPQIKEVELIVVNDCSNDHTAELINEYAKAHKNIKVFHHVANKGKGAALRTGFAEAEGDLVIVQDADLEYNPNEFNLLLKPIIENNADVVYGSRFAGGESHRVLYYSHTMGNKFLTFLSNLFSDINLTDMETCYKLFKKDIIKNITIEENRFGFEPEITAKTAALCRHKGIKIYEVGISYHGRTYQEGKKIGFIDGVRALWCICRYNTSFLAYLIKYCTTGSFLTLLQTAIIIFFPHNFHFINGHKNISAFFFSTILCLPVIFVLHGLFTWRGRCTKKIEIFPRLPGFLAISFISICLKYCFLFYFPAFSINFILNFIISSMLISIYNFLTYDRIVFK